MSQKLVKSSQKNSPSERISPQCIALKRSQRLRKKISWLTVQFQTRTIKKTESFSKMLKKFKRSNQFTKLIFAS